jgi:hypothetical protein
MMRRFSTFSEGCICTQKHKGKSSNRLEDLKAQAFFSSPLHNPINAGYHRVCVSLEKRNGQVLTHHYIAPTYAVEEET